MAADGGHVLLVASLAAHRPAPLMSAYGASKAYVPSSPRSCAGNKERPDTMNRNTESHGTNSAQRPDFRDTAQLQLFGN